MTRRAAVAVLVLLAACGADGPAGAAPAAPSPAAAPAGPHELIVFATASLRRPFTALARRYEQDHPGAKVTLRCEGGWQLLDAVNAGAPVDVIAIGDSSLMSRFAAATHLAAHSPAELARNRIAIAVAKGNPKNVRGLADFGRADVRVALGARSSSIGRWSSWALSRLHLEPKPAVQANAADALLAKVAAGEADAAIVYATSFLDADGEVERVDVPEEHNPPVLYSISAARSAPQPQAAAAFRALALSADGQQILRDAGFLPIGAK